MFNYVDRHIVADTAPADQAGLRRLRRVDGAPDRHGVHARALAVRDPDRALGRSRLAPHGDRGRRGAVERDDGAFRSGAQLLAAPGAAHGRRHRRGGGRASGPLDHLGLLRARRAARRRSRCSASASTSGSCSATSRRAGSVSTSAGGERFLVVGLPGLALALLVRLTVREPPRATAVESHGLSEVLRYLLGKARVRGAARRGVVPRLCELLGGALGARVPPARARSVALRDRPLAGDRLGPGRRRGIAAGRDARRSARAARSARVPVRRRGRGLRLDPLRSAVPVRSRRASRRSPRTCRTSCWSAPTTGRSSPSIRAWPSRACAPCRRPST